jgi:hypothetical protein
MRKKHGDFTLIPIDEVTATPKKSGFINVVTNHWWAVSDNCIMIYRGHSIQANIHKSITEKLNNNKLYPPDTKTVFLETVYLLHECSDYC